MFAQATSCNESNLWSDYIVWDLVKLLNGTNVIDCKYVFKIKKDSL